MPAVPIGRYAPPQHGILAEAFLRLVAVVSSTRAALRRFFCGLRGHEMVLHFERDRLSLSCLRCGANTCGWTFDAERGFPAARGRARTDRTAQRRAA